MKPDDTIKIARLAVQTRIWPLYEVESGEKYTLNLKVDNPKPVIEYLKLQGRFRHLKEDDIARIQQLVDHEWQKLMKNIS